MNRRKLFRYIREAQQSGVGAEEITQLLLDAGWKRSDIEFAFDIISRGRESFLHVHFLHRHLSPKVSAGALVAILTLTGLISGLYARSTLGSNELLVQNGENGKIIFEYGSWPILENAKFFEKVKQDFISQKADFIEADLSSMKLRVYSEGLLATEVPIGSKGREGSWWETPAGLYKIESMEKSHYSSFGHVYMPWSMQFQGNFFIHGWPYYADGSPVAQGYSGGCIRLADKNAESVYRLAKTGMPVLVFKESFITNTADTKYAPKSIVPDTVSYLAADLQNNFVFAEHLSSDQRFIASITKLMTALVAVEYINIEREVSITSPMVATTSIPRLSAGNKTSVLDLLSLLLLESSNEAALAITSPLGQSHFVDLMNRKAATIGMANSRFTDTSGIIATNTSTATDLFMLAKYLYYNRSFVLHMSMGNENRAAYGPSQYKNLSNLNEISGLEKMIGGKVAESSAAQGGMLAVFKMNVGEEMRPVAIIVLGSKDSKRDVKTLFDYVQANFDAQ
ncbi:MAG: hypothetical protein COZ49_03705 [Candidatus Yonathbacteria bacterium CG_4_10_14_3_um_filter_47_65]|uniref:L,D-TPase catalytic domain-containing protein n=1 Tax=Candidatus Yonathbacteria bacterium CG_4_9_14_0_8_um_filter_46_47 TaxID=1975106 RepID=A0A2M8D795_9BACT|nr:MAG: hypothetical protein COZ49_03705 [Candidatus Yonathbacteria bacterium CG_4_10_14_3_um_filter_47_65]PJB83040.1 MAG: hypothetical protein CO088_02370 [Candidatus Yonathbacteria bacterium CG_4_9_14_0_8_um_filter_46_47]